MAFLQHKCTSNTCPQLKSHGSMYVNDIELNKLGACIEENSLKLAIVQMFGAIFQWKNQKYIAALFNSLSVERKVAVRHDPMTRKFEIIREESTSVIRVLTYSGYMEILTICEEDFSKVKTFSVHPIFSKAKNRFNSPADPYDSANLGCIVCNDGGIQTKTFTQYSRGIHVPFKRSKIKHLKAAKGEVDEVGKELNEKKSHIHLFEQKGLEAAEMINKLFI